MDPRLQGLGSRKQGPDSTLRARGASGGLPANCSRGCRGGLSWEWKPGEGAGLSGKAVQETGPAPRDTAVPEAEKTVSLLKLSLSLLTYFIVCYRVGKRSEEK